jgi:hypothetical protein
MFAARPGYSIDSLSDGLQPEPLPEMSPSSFTFKLSVPSDPDSIAIIGEVARHAAEYARLDAGAAAVFAERARSTAGKALTAPGQAALAVFAAADGTLTLTIGGESVSQPLS